MKLHRSGLWTQLVDASPDERRALQESLTVEEKDNTYCLYDEERGRFLSGLTDLVSKDMLIRGLEVDLEWGSVNEVAPPLVLVPDNILPNITLRDYQGQLSTEACSKRVGLIKVPTAGGKTVIGAAIMQAIDRPSVFFVNSVPLTNQIPLKFRQYGLERVGIIGDGRFEPDHFTVANIQWFAQLLKRQDPKLRHFIREREVVIFDEVHHLAAKSWMSVALALGQADWRIGLSGTPYNVRERNSYRDLVLMGVCGSLLGELSASFLIERGYIADPHIFFISVNTPKVPALPYGAPQWQRNKDFNRVYEKGVVNHPTRNKLALGVIETLVTEQSLNTLVLVQRIEHGHTLLRELEKLDITAVFLAGAGKVYYQGDGEIEEGQDEIEDFASSTVRDYTNGKYQVLIASPVLGEGYDLPDSAVEALVILAGQKSLIPVLQRLGRALRPKPGDNRVLVFDFDDNQHYYLKNHSRRRRQEYSAEGYKVFEYSSFIRNFVSKEDPGVA